MKVKVSPQVQAFTSKLRTDGLGARFSRNPVLRIGISLGWTVAAGMTVPTGAMTFTDVTMESGLAYDQNNGPALYQQAIKSGGAAPGDYDGDGWIDVYVTRLDHTNLLFRNRGDGTFEDVTAAVFGSNHLRYFKSNGCAWADIDNDGDLDLHVTHLDANRYHLFINDGSGGFSEEAVARGADVSGSGPNFGFSTAFGDYDLDGYLDFHVTEWRHDYQNPGDNLQNNRLFRNLGAAKPGYFEDVTAAAGVATDAIGAADTLVDTSGYASRIVDIDRDGLPDLLLAADVGRSRIFWNDGDGTFTDGTATAGIGSDRNGMGSALGDYDQDGDLDWLVTSIYDPLNTAAADGNRLYRYDGARHFSEQQDSAGVRNGMWGWGATFCDFDHDGDLDLAQTNGVPGDFSPNPAFAYDQTRLWENDGSGAFTDRAGVATGVTDTRQGKALFTFDYDRDGDMDIFIVNAGGQPVLYRNETDSGDWLQVRLSGRHSNREGIGAYVTVNRGGDAKPLVREMSGGNNFLSHDEHLVHFGFGELGGTAIESLVVEWPSGASQILKDVDPNRVIRLVEPDLRAAISMVGDHYDLSWNSCTGWSYEVEYTTDLETGNWIKLGETLEASGPSSSVAVAASSARCYYRVVARP